MTFELIVFRTLCRKSCRKLECRVDLRLNNCLYWTINTTKKEEDEPTEDEPKSLCIKLDCRVEMGVGNFLYSTLDKTKEEKFQRVEEKFQRAIEKAGMEKYLRYQKANAKNNISEIMRNGEKMSSDACDIWINCVPTVRRGRAVRLTMRRTVKMNVIILIRKHIAMLHQAQ